MAVSPESSPLPSWFSAQQCRSLSGTLIFANSNHEWLKNFRSHSKPQKVVKMSTTPADSGFMNSRRIGALSILVAVAAVSSPRASRSPDRLPHKR